MKKEWFEEDPFESKILKSNKGKCCWTWQGSISEGGYGSYLEKGAHVISFQRHYRKIVPPGYEVHHRCLNRSCVNPDHLEMKEKSEHLKYHAADRKRKLSKTPKEYFLNGYRIQAWTEKQAKYLLCNSIWIFKGDDPNVGIFEDEWGDDKRESVKQNRKRFSKKKNKPDNPFDELFN